MVYLYFHLTRSIIKTGFYKKIVIYKVPEIPCVILNLCYVFKGLYSILLIYINELSVQYNTS